MSSQDIVFDAVQRAVIEDWQRSAMAYGWKLAHIGLPVPDPLFEWRGGCPEVVADGAAPTTDLPCATCDHGWVTEADPTSSPWFPKKPIRTVCKDCDGTGRDPAQEPTT